MSMSTSALERAAAAVETLLDQAGRASDEALAAPLASRAELERCAAALEESARLSAGVEPVVRTLLDALAARLTVQKDRGEELRARAEELAARRVAYEELLQRYSSLGGAAREVHGLLQSFGNSGELHRLPTTSLAEIEAALSRLIQGATRAGEAAREQEFEDLAGEAEFLRRELSNARGSLRAAAERFSGAPLQ